VLPCLAHVLRGFPTQNTQVPSPHRRLRLSAARQRSVRARRHAHRTAAAEIARQV